MFGEIDVEDAIAGVVFSLSAAVSTGIATISIFGYDLSGSLIVIEGRPVSFAFFLTVAALVTAYATNRMDDGKSVDVETDIGEWLKGNANMETYLLVGTVATVLLNGFNVLGVHDIIIGSAIIGVIVMAVQSAGYWVISYMG